MKGRRCLLKIRQERVIVFVGVCHFLERARIGIGFLERARSLIVSAMDGSYIINSFVSDQFE